MKSENRILLAFLLNFTFSVIEFIGGFFTGSVAIASDALHDLGDAVSIGISYVLEKKSKRQPNGVFTYGYGRYSVLGSLITTMILLIGSVAVIGNGINKIINPTEIHYDGMILLGVVGVCVNLLAAVLTRQGDSLGQKAVNLHMLEDVLGWIAVLFGAVIMRYTDIAIIDPILSVCIGAFILISAVRTLKSTIEVFLEKAPRDIDIDEVRTHVLQIEGVADIHHIHLWSLDGQNNYATMHIVTSGDAHRIKEMVREELAEQGIVHVTLELEDVGEHCHHTHCHVELKSHNCHHHHKH